MCKVYCIIYIIYRGFFAAGIWGTNARPGNEPGKPLYQNNVALKNAAKTFCDYMQTFCFYLIKASKAKRTHAQTTENAHKKQAKQGKGQTKTDKQSQNRQAKHGKQAAAFALVFAKTLSDK